MTPQREHRWRFIVHEGRLIRNVVLLPDGTASGEGVDPAAALSAAQWAIAREKEKRSASAQKAAASRERRTSQRLLLAMDRQIAGLGIPPGTPIGKCFICRHKLTDDESQRRGIGSDCWARMMDGINERMTRGAR